jgi:hypothetical protein
MNILERIYVGPNCDYSMTLIRPNFEPHSHNKVDNRIYNDFPIELPIRLGCATTISVALHLYRDTRIALVHVENHFREKLIVNLIREGENIYRTAVAHGWR